MAAMNSAARSAKLSVGDSPARALISRRAAAARPSSSLRFREHGACLGPIVGRPGHDAQVELLEGAELDLALALGLLGEQRLGAAGVGVELAKRDLPAALLGILGDGAAPTPWSSKS